MEKTSNKESTNEKKYQDEKIENYGQVTLEQNKQHSKIHLLTIIGEIEGHDVLGSNSKTTKYEHIIPQLAAFEDDSSFEGLLILMQT